MRHKYIDLTASYSSSSSTDRNDFYVRSHFRWQSIKKFIYVAHAFSTTSFSFDMFSKVLAKIHLFEYILYAIFIGVSYMFMDFFIKQYTRRLDTNKNLNPLMKGVSFGILLQTAFWALLHASDLADSLRFFLVSMNRTPTWSRCQKINTNVTCMSSQDVLLHCREKVMVDIKITSAHLNYMKLFSNIDKNSLSMRLFVIAIVWIGNFFIATVTDNALLMIFKFSFLWGTFSTAFILVFLLFSTQYTSKAFYDLMDIQDVFRHNAFNLVTDPFGVGLIGVYDFGMMSPFTMVDNAVLIFAFVFIVTSFARSLIIRVLYLMLTNCVDVNITESPHYLLFAILPLSTEFMDAHKIFVLYIYSYLTAALVACLAMFTTIIARLLHSEYRAVKNIYIVGLLCFLGFNLSIAVTLLTTQKIMGIMYGLNTCSLYLGGMKVAIVMWLYGVQRYSTDIHFWLGFKPTQFWKCIWVMLPIVIWTAVFNKLKDMNALKDASQKIVALLWMFLTLITVVVIQAKVIAKYILQNNIVGVFRSNFKYGPPEIDDRKKRRNFDEITQSRQCRHDCMILDDKYECNHLPLIFRSRSSLPSAESSLTNIYEDSSKPKKTSSVLDVSVMNMN
nr:sodium-dependent dopamine transporter-like [Vanessa tameamea]